MNTPSGTDATIIIPQRGQSELTHATIAALRHFELCPWPIIVVDDGSPAAASEQLHAIEDSSLFFLEQPPKGITAAWNLALDRVTTPFAVLLNNDVQITGPWVDRLTHPLRQHAAQVTGVEWRDEPDLPMPLAGTSLLAGWCFAFPVSVWQEIHGFDEALTLYYSDTDFQARLLMKSLHLDRPSAIRRTNIPATSSEMAAELPAVLTVVERLPLRHLAHQSTRVLPDRALRHAADRQQFLQKWRLFRDHPRSSPG